MRPQRLYKYLDAAGAAAFLERPQIRFTDFRKLDDPLEVLPGFRCMTEDELSAIAQNHDLVRTGAMEAAKVAFFYETLSKVSPFELEAQMRAQVANLPSSLFVCSLTSRCDCIPMWSSYAARHRENSEGVILLLLRFCYCTDGRKPENARVQE